MGTATVEILTPDAARAKRRELLESVGGDEADLRARGDAYALSARELAVLDELIELDYLLGVSA